MKEYQKIKRMYYEKSFGNWKKCEKRWEDIEFEELDKDLKLAISSETDEKELKEKYYNDYITKLGEGKIISTPFIFYREKTNLAKCPICGCSFDIKRPAISRRDNKTKICSDCGIREAFEDYLNIR